jgi:hypothetical protein
MISSHEKHLERTRCLWTLKLTNPLLTSLSQTCDETWPGCASFPACQVDDDLIELKGWKAVSCVIFTRKQLVVDYGAEKL